MYKIKEAIIVEGKYDKNKLRQIFDTVILDTGGFSIFHNKEKVALIRKLAEERGVIVLSDSDGAGFVIRNFLKNILDQSNVKHAYIPDIYGREKRKKTASGEGKLGVEGIKDDIIIQAVRRSGAVFGDGCQPNAVSREITVTDLYSDGIYGGRDSRKKRSALLKKYDLPEFLSTKALIQMLNIFSSYEEYKNIVEEFHEK